MEIRILDGECQWLRKQGEFRGRLREKIKDLLKRVTGGAKGRGEQIRSFMKEEKYIPKARRVINLFHLVRKRKINISIGPIRDTWTHPRASSPYPKKKKAGRRIMKNVCVPREDV
jgi:hypothetical protein